MHFGPIRPSVVALVVTLPIVGCDSRTPSPPAPTAAASTTTPAAAGPQSRPSSPQQVASDAIAACCGEIDLSKYNTGRTKARVRSEQAGGGFSLDGTAAEVYRLPGYLRRDVEGEGQDSRGKHPAKYTYIWNGEWAWTTGDDGRLHKVRATVPASNMFPDPYLGQLAALRRPDTQLYLSSQTEWRGKPVNVIHVLAPDGRRSDLIFDRTTKLLIATRRDLPDPATGGRETTPAETEFADFRNVRGMWLPMSFVSLMKGKRLFDVTVLEFEPLESVDDRLFVGPEEE